MENGKKMYVTAEEAAEAWCINGLCLQDYPGAE